jgi:hypothetical protein
MGWTVMTHYARIEIGDADCPDERLYVSAETALELAGIVAAQCQTWQDTLGEVYPQSDEFYAYEFRLPGDGENNYSQRLRIAGGGDRILDVTGLTREEFKQESAT